MMNSFSLIMNGSSLNLPLNRLDNKALASDRILFMNTLMYIVCIPLIPEYLFKSTRYL